MVCCSERRENYLRRKCCRPRVVSFPRPAMPCAARMSKSGGPHVFMARSLFLFACRSGKGGAVRILHHQQLISSGSAAADDSRDGFHLGVVEIGAAGVQVLAFFLADENIDLRRVLSSFTGNVIHDFVPPPADPDSGATCPWGYTRVSSFLLLRSMVKSSFFLYRSSPFPAT